MAEPSGNMNSGTSSEVLRRKYLFALGILAALSLAAFLILRAIIGSGNASAQIINISGRQRMLSQRIALFSELLVNDEEIANRSLNRAQLKSAIRLMRRSHEGLLRGNESLGLPGNPSPALSAIYYKSPYRLNVQVDRFLDQSLALADLPDSKLEPANRHLRYVRTSASRRLLQSLDAAVRQYEAEADNRIAVLQLMQTGTLAVILVVLVMEGILIFRPMVTEIDTETRELKELAAQEHRIAHILQKGLIPKELPAIEGLDVRLYFQSATRLAEVGGDFWDFFPLADGRWGIVMGDVAGNGIHAAAETARAKYLVRDRAHGGIPPSDVLFRVNNSLVEQNPDRFTALTYGIYNPKTSLFHFSNAGNPFPYTTNGDRFLEITSVPMSLLRDEEYPSLEIEFQPGDTLLMYTDGLVEPRHNLEFFGAERVRNFVMANPDLPLEDLLAALIEEARTFSNDTLTDDILLIGLRRQ